ncbi:MAG: hypothetical protein V9H25_06550 [Candidatus Competibacter sp.]
MMKKSHSKDNDALSKKNRLHQSRPATRTSGVLSGFWKPGRKFIPRKTVAELNIF